MELSLTDDEKLALAALLKRTIEDDRYPLSPRLRPLKAILTRLEPPRAVAEPYPAPPRRSPSGPGHDHINLPSAAFGAHQFLAPIEHGRCGAVPSGHLGRIGLDLMLTSLAPDDQPGVGRGPREIHPRWHAGEPRMDRLKLGFDDREVGTPLIGLAEGEVALGIVRHAP